MGTIPRIVAHFDLDGAGIATGTALGEHEERVPLQIAARAGQAGPSRRVRKFRGEVRTPSWRGIRFAYTTPCHKDRERYPFQLRDADAALYLTDALRELGYRYSGPIINYPSKGPDLIAVDASFLRKTDLILLTTRPPMNDHEIGNKKGIPRSFTTLEEKLFEGPLREWIKTCARSETLLTTAAAGISPEIAERQAVEFRQNGGAMYQAYGSPVTREWRRFRRRHPLTAFAMGGTETLVWCRELATRLPHLLCTTPFVMAEMRTGRLSERPATMDFADAWEITILGAAERTPARDPKRAA